MERTIRVTGKGKLSLKPDRIRLLVTQSDQRYEYADTVARSSEQKAELNAALAELGFDKADLKTLHFNINTVYDSYKDKNGNWKQQFKGYSYTHRMKLEFPADNALLGRVLYTIAHCAAKPEFSIEHTIADPEKAKNELLAKAVADSMMKAKVLTNAAGVTLGHIQSIDYSWGEIEFVSRPMNAMKLMDSAPMCAEGAGYDMDIEADDIDVTDTVTVVWSIS